MRKLQLLNTSEYLTEQSIRRALEGTPYRLFTQLPLRKVIQRDQGERLSRGDRKFLQSADLDFVIFNADSFPELAIEFDGPAHTTYDKQRERDIRKNRLCQRARLPLIRISDIHLEQHDQATLLEYIVKRFAYWEAEKEELFAELYEYLATASEEEVTRLTEGGILDPMIDPTVTFNLRHPFPGTDAIAARLFAQFGIVSSHLALDVWHQATSQPRVLEFSWHQGRMDNQPRHIVVTRNYELLRKVRQTNGRVDVTRIHDVQVSFRTQWALPVSSGSDRGGAQSQQFAGVVRATVAIQDVPGISMLELAENFCEYLALRRIEGWAKENLNSSTEKGNGCAINCDSVGNDN